MAAPKKNATKPDDPRQAKTRAAIKTTQLVNRLQSFALGEKEAVAKEGEEAKEIELDANRLRAIEILLRKALPDLSAMTLETGESGLHIHLGSDAKKV